MDSAELGRRHPVWDALADVFLDTETRWYFPRIALVLADSGYSSEELDRIWRWEMVPECVGNLRQVAGEWGALALDETALIRRATRPPRLWARLFARPSLAWLEGQWREILALRSRLLERVAGERSAVVGAWSAFASAYLEERLEKVLFLDGKIESLRQTGLSRAACESTFAGELRPIYARLLIAKEKGSETARAANVRELIARAFR